MVHSGRREEEEENAQSKLLLVLEFSFCLFSLKVFGEISQWLRTHTDLTEDPHSAPSTHSNQAVHSQL